jgi:hypothetical protein
MFLIKTSNSFLIHVVDCDLSHPGVTALAHPASIEIGLNHGVFVLDMSANEYVAKDGYDNFSLQLQQMDQKPAKCLQFLHKPNREKMHSAGALLSNSPEAAVRTTEDS